MPAALVKLVAALIPKSEACASMSAAKPGDCVDHPLHAPRPSPEISAASHMAESLPDTVIIVLNRSRNIRRSFCRWFAWEPPTWLATHAGMVVHCAGSCPWSSASQASCSVMVLVVLAGRMRCQARCA